MSQPPVSVIIPTYNYGTTIRDAINSVLNQTYSSNKIEIIVVDDGSTDNTKKKLENYMNHITYIYQENKGKAAATNVALKNATGKYIFNLDADDLFVENKIERVVQIFEKENEIVHIGHPAIYWNTVKQIKSIENIPEVIKGRKIYGYDLLKYFYNRKILYGGGSTFAAKSDVLHHFTIPFEIDMHIDEYLLLYCLKQGYSYFINEPLSIWRKHNNNFSNYSGTNPYNMQKKQRIRNSAKNLLFHLKNSNHEKVIKDLYLLKFTVNELAYQEENGEKNISGILFLWKLFFEIVYFHKLNPFLLIKSYTLINRSMPSFLIHILKKIITDNKMCCI